MDVQGSLDELSARIRHRFFVIIPKNGHAPTDHITGHFISATHISYHKSLINMVHGYKYHVEL